MTLLSHLRRLPTAIRRCKYSPGSCPIICCGRSVFESHTRQLSTFTIRSQLSVQLFHPSSNGFQTQLLYKYKYGNRDFNSNCSGSNVSSISQDERWEMMYKELVQYEGKHGDALVPAKYPDNPQLGSWVDAQRQNRKKNKLAPERVDKLDSIGFVWDPLEAAWEEMFEELKQYKREHGDTLVPAKYPDNPQLGTWVDTQKQNRKNNHLTPERADKLNGIGFVWDVNEAAWEEMFQQLKQYKHDHGDTLVPWKHPNNPQLGTWVSRQRINRRENKLAPERVGKLNETGFVWDANEAAWEEMLQQLKEYKKVHGDTLVPQRYTDNLQLGNWVSKQRKDGKSNKLAPERVDKLNVIGFVWDVEEAAWQSKYESLHSFYKNFGHTKIPTGEEEHEELYYWCMRQRYLKAKGSLKGDRYDQLKKIKFDFFRRKVTRGSSLIENMIIYELEKNSHEFDMLNKEFFGVRLFPDGVIVHNESVIFVEIDEKYHSCHSNYPIKRELGRMVTLKKEAAAQGYNQTIFVRIGIGDRRKVDKSQLEFVINHLHGLKRNIHLQPNRCSHSIHYIDYPEDHHHVLASKPWCDEVLVLNSQ